MIQTTNGVKVTFDNNIVEELGEKPLLVFEKDGDGTRLVEVNLDGYHITKVKRMTLDHMRLG